MEVSRRLYVQSFVFALVVIAAAGHALEMEYISPIQKQQLVDDFEHAKLEQADALANKKWSCDMFGVRSRMQVQHNVKLYSLSKGPSGSFRNQGAQAVSEYRLQNGVLSGKSGKFEDNLRVKPNGQLISKLTVLQPEPVVIAYSVCNVL